jgi:bifunctional UDP-N-acetylglucosamine pyrophosphorylase/glucosamine-1-phosphate N-acetyltransferase
MKSDLPKVLHEICGKPMLWYVVEACRQAGVSKLAIVVGHRQEDVRAAFAAQTDIQWIEQKEQKGTGHAAMVCEPALGGFDGPVLTIAGDMPLIQGRTLTMLLEESARTGDAVTLATCILDDPTSYGRIVRDADGALAAIVEHNDCTPDQKAIREVNVSYYCFDGSRMFDLMHQLRNDNAKGEYYITDAVKIALAGGQGAGAVPAVPPADAMGINSRADLAVVGRLMQNRIQARWLDSGVSIIDPGSTWIESGATIGKETVILPFSYIGADAAIGDGCRIGPHGHVPSNGFVPEYEMVSGGGSEPGTTAASASVSGVAVSGAGASSAITAGQAASGGESAGSGTRMSPKQGRGG